MRTFPRLLSLLAALTALPLSATITGSVMNSDGQAIAGAKISIYGPESLSARRERLASKTPERTPTATATVDGNGNFKIDAPKDMPIVDLRVDAAGYAPDSTRLQSDDDAGALVLTHADSKSVTIRADGKPLAGATVIFNGGATFVATTDANGRFSVPDPSKWANRMIIFHPSYARLEENIQQGKHDFDRTLNAGVKVSGKVVGADGTSGVADAAIDVDGWPAGKSGADGTFTVEHAPKTWQEVRAISGSSIAARANSAGALVLKLAKGATISGTVKDIKSQMPLANAEVSISFGGGPGGRFGFGGGNAFNSVTTDTKGNYSFSPVAAGSYVLNVNRPNYMIPFATLAVGAAQAQSKSFFGTAMGRITGTVLDENQKPVAAARVSEQRAGRGDPLAMLMVGMRGGQGRLAFSGPDGRFVARIAELDADVHIGAVKKGFPPTTSPIMRFAAGEKKSGLTLVIPRGVAFTGRVIDKQGKPVSGVAVETVESQNDPFGQQIRRLVIAGNGARGEENVTTGSDGTFTVRLKEGKYDVVFKREGFAAKTLRAQTVSANEKPVEITLDPGVEVSGRVTRGGVGVEGVNVNAISELGNASAITLGDGSFTLSDLTPGQMMLIVNKQDAMIQETRPVSAPARDVNIAVPVGGRVTGRVVDKATHQPITSFQAGVTTSRGGGGMMIMTPPILKPFTSDDGSFVLENVKPGPTQITASAPGYTSGKAPTVEIEDGKEVHDIEVALEAGAKLVGKVTDSSGIPLSGVTVRPDTMNAGGRGGRVMNFAAMDSQAATDPNGEYTLDSLEPGDQTFIFSRSGYVDESKTVTLTGGKDSRLDVTLGSGLRITGQVVSDAGAPVSEATVNASSAAGGFRQAHTDANGNFQLEGLAQGHYNFTASKSGLANGTLQDVDIATQNNVRITMKSGGTISGHVTGLSADELQNTTVTANGPSGNAASPVDSSGNYRIDGAPSGTVRVGARTGQLFGGTNRSAQAQTIQLDPGGTATVDIQFKSDTTIRGRVISNNQPVGSATVTFVPRQGRGQTSASVRSDSSGNYEITGLDDGAYNVQVVDMTNLTPYTTTYTVSGSGTFDIEMHTSSLRGRVLDSATGQGIDSATIDIRPVTGEGFLGTRTAQADSTGTFMLDNVARGTYQISADKPGYGHQMKEISVADTAADVELKLDPSDGITLKVIDGRDGTALNANVRATDLQGNPMPGGSPFGFGGGTPSTIKLALAPGTYRVTVSAMNYATRTMLISAPSSQTVALTPGGTLIIHSKANVQLRGRLTDSSGNSYFSGPFNNVGAFRLEMAPGVTTLQNVAAGHYRLDVLDTNDQVIKSIDVDVIDGRPSEYEV